MRSDILNEAVENRLCVCRHLLRQKGVEYTSDIDRLKNFKQAAYLQNTTPEKALASMMAKHVVAIYEFIDRAALGETTSYQAWAEKITDTINYLLLLDAMVGAQSGGDYGE